MKKLFFFCLNSRRGLMFKDLQFFLIPRNDLLFDKLVFFKNKISLYFTCIYRKVFVKFCTNIAIKKYTWKKTLKIYLQIVVFSDRYTVLGHANSAEDEQFLESIFHLYVFIYSLTKFLDTSQILSSVLLVVLKLSTVYQT